MRSKILRFGLPVFLAVALFGAFKYFYHPQSNIITISGNIEATTVDLSFKIPGRMIVRRVDEGDTVKKGELIARLDDVLLKDAVAEQKANVKASQWALTELLRGSRPEAIAQARADEQRTRYALDELLHGSRPEEIAQARAAAQQARVEAARSRREYLRESQLFRQGFISALAYDNEKASYRAAADAYRQAEQHYIEVVRGPRVEDIEQAREAWKQAQWNLRELVNGPRIEDIEQARARLKSAQDALAQAKRTLHDATLYAPISGVVLSKDTEAGEYVQAGTPVVTAADLADVWLRAYIDESDLGKIKLNMPVKVTTDSYPGKVYHGYISFISSEAEFTPKTVQTEEERTKLVYRIKINLLNPNMELKPGMPADAELDLHGSHKG